MNPLAQWQDRHWKHSFKLFQTLNFGGEKRYIFTCEICELPRMIASKRFWTGTVR